MVERRWRENYADLEFAREVIEGLSNEYSEYSEYPRWRYGRNNVRKLSTSSLGFRFMTFEVGDRLINPPSFAVCLRLITVYQL